jgi:para-aminobenzoate synthetase component 1
MISTVTPKLDPQYWQLKPRTISDGGMTELQNFSYENTRNWKRPNADCTGSSRLFHPDGDFDFNVVIRSILYNQENQYVFSVRRYHLYLFLKGRIRRMPLKAKAMREVLE